MEGKLHTWDRNTSNSALHYLVQRHALAHCARISLDFSRTIVQSLLLVSSYTINFHSGFHLPIIVDLHNVMDGSSSCCCMLSHKTISSNNLKFSITCLGQFMRKIYFRNKCCEIEKETNDLRFSKQSVCGILIYQKNRFETRGTKGELHFCENITLLWLFPKLR